MGQYVFSANNGNIVSEIRLGCFIIVLFVVVLVLLFFFIFNEYSTQTNTSILKKQTPLNLELIRVTCVPFIVDCVGRPINKSIDYIM